MDFILELQHFFLQRGFQKMKYGSRIVLVREDKERTALVDIVPERLPGQPETDISALEKEAGKLENMLMVRLGRRVERLTLMLCSDLPDQKQIEETMEYPDIWWLDEKHARLLIYEKQRTDFLGLKNELEEFVLGWSRKKKQESRLEWKRMLQPVTTALVLINVLVFIVLSFLGRTEDPGFMAAHGAMTFDLVVRDGQYYRLFTAMFLHFGLEHLLQNMLILMLTGSRLERAVGRVRYLIIYLGAGLASSVTSVFFTLRGNGDIAAGASGAIFGIMGALAALLLVDAVRRQRRYTDEIGLSGIIFMIVCAASYGFFNTGIDNAAHIGGLVGGFLLALVMSVITG